MYTGPITDPHQHLWDYKYKYFHGWLQIDSHPWTGDWTMPANNYLITITLKISKIKHYKKVFMLKQNGMMNLVHGEKHYGFMQ